jgi:predicted nucleic acid-binding protein
MRRYLLDTAPLAAFLLGRPWMTALVSPWIAQEEAATSMLVFGEIVEYIRGTGDFLRRYHQLRQLLDSGHVYPYTLAYSIVERYADLRRALRPPHGGGLIGDIDTLVAATALDRGLTLVTTDTDYQRVPGLSLQLLPRRP